MSPSLLAYPATCFRRTDLVSVLRWDAQLEIREKGWARCVGTTGLRLYSHEAATLPGYLMLTSPLELVKSPAFSGIHAADYIVVLEARSLISHQL